MRIAMLFLLLLPALEIFLLVKIGDLIGALLTIAWVIVAAFIGINVLRYQGISTVLKAAKKMRTGGQPVKTIAHAIIKSLGAVLLIIPGFATDALAILCFIPVLRSLLLKRWLAKFIARAAFSRTNFKQSAQSSGNIYDQPMANRFDSDPELTGRILEHDPDKKI